MVIFRLEMLLPTSRITLLLPVTRPHLLPWLVLQNLMILLLENMLTAILLTAAIPATMARLSISRHIRETAPPELEQSLPLRSFGKHTTTLLQFPPTASSPQSILTSSLPTIITTSSSRCRQPFMPAMQSLRLRMYLTTFFGAGISGYLKQQLPQVHLVEFLLVL